MNNQSGTLPGSGYGGEYYSHHSNDSTPTSPSYSSGSLNVQNSTLPPSSCDCSQISNVQEVQPTSDQPGASGTNPADTAAAPPNAPGGSSK